VRDDSSLVVDNGGDAGIGGARHVAPGLQGAQAGDLQMLMRRQGVAEPGVVADVDQELRLRQAGADLTAEHRSKQIDTPTGCPAACRSGCARSPAVKSAIGIST